MTLEMFTDLGGALVAAVHVPSVGRGNANQIAAPGNPKAFQGNTYSPRLDEARLNGQLKRVRDLMADQVWRSLSEISSITGDPESSVSARLRDLRRPCFGLYTVKRRRRSQGTYEYSVSGRAL